MNALPAPPAWPPWTELALGLGALLLAYATARGFTPRVREAAIRFGIVDRPDGKLKLQREPVPYLGGLAVAIGVLVGVGVTFEFERDLLAMLLAGSIVLVLGLVDDLGSLTPRAKLAGQFLAALVLVKAGVRIQLVFLPDWVEIPLTLLWVVGATNAFNLVDIMDGLSSGIGAVAALFMSALAFASGMNTTAFLAASLAGALWGFRHFNVEPARIYMGDTGSLFAGFLLAALAMVNRYTVEHPLGAVAPLLILGVPLFDMLLVMVIRWHRGVPVMQGSPDHVALRLRRRGLSTRATVRTLVGTGAVLGGLGTAVVLLPQGPALAVVVVAALAGVGVAGWLMTIRMT